ncbi:MAG: DUF937 domain-containing protein, partial [Gemmatimonadota bacterium]|nr:DUF937 domain-containing protein [Gemmatimonadota bacterium]
MPGLLDQLAGQLSGDALESLSSTIGADQKQTQSAMAAALPLLLGALAKNAAKPKGAEALDKALARDHDGSIFDNLSGALRSPNLEDGQGILKHVLGGRRDQVESSLSKASGLGGDQVTKMLATLAPLVLGSLGRAKRSSGMGVEDLSNMLNEERNAMESKEPALGGLLRGLLDRDGDGSILDDLAGGALGRLFG